MFFTILVLVYSFERGVSSFIMVTSKNPYEKEEKSDIIRI